MTSFFILAGAAWLLLTLLLGIYITGWRMSIGQQIRIGFRTLTVLYVLGVLLLLVASVVLG